MTNSFWIGLYPGMGNEAIGYMINTLKKYIKGN